MEKSVDASQPYQEDWGWELPAKYGSDAYYLCMSGNAEDSSANNEWRIIIEKKRSIAQRISGKGKITADDGMMMRLVEDILRSEPTIHDVYREES